MAHYRLLFFRGNRLERWHSFDEANPVAALERAARQPFSDTLELWSEAGRMAIFWPAGRLPH